MTMLLPLLQVGLSLGTENGLISSEWMYLFIKWLFVIGFGLYVIFAIVVTRQIHIMRRTLITPFSSVLTTIGFIHLAMAIGFFLFVLLTL